MKKGALIFFLAAVTVLVVVGCLVRAHVNKAKDVRAKTMMVEKLKTEIANELPVGTDKDKIIAFLASHQIRHSDVIKWSTVDSNPKRALLISASVPLEVERYSRKDLIFSFYFDEAGTLQDREISESKTAD